MLEQVELLVFIHHFLGQPEAVERFAAQTEHGLQLHIARFSDGPTGRIAFRNEQRSLVAVVGLQVRQVVAAVAQFFVVQTGLFGTIIGEFFNTGEFFALPLRLLNAFLERVAHGGVHVQEVV